MEAPFLATIREHAGALRRYYEIREWQFRESTVVPPSLRRTNLYVPDAHRASHSDGRPGGYVAHLYWQEVSPVLREALIAEGLAINADRPTFEGREPSSRWISMDPMLAWVYKCALTDELARRNHLVPTTDQMAAHRASQEWDTERVRTVLLRGRQSRADQAVSAVLGELAVRMVLPADLANVSVGKVIELRQKHAAEFETFMGEVDGVAREMQEHLAEIEDREVLAARLRQLHRTRFERPLNDLKAAMKSSRSTLPLECSTSRRKRRQSWEPWAAMWREGCPTPPPSASLSAWWATSGRSASSATRPSATPRCPSFSRWRTACGLQA